MNTKTVGVVGMGVVGKSIFKGMAQTHQVFGHDLNPLFSINSLSDVSGCDFIFLCLPTPSLSDGSANISSIHNAIEEIIQKKQYRKSSVFVLKSTVPMGTTTNIEKKYSINIVHCPEFLSSKTAEIDFITTTRVIIGSNLDSNSNIVSELFLSRFPGINIIKVTPEESEFIKYFLNCFYATKITFFNEMRLLADNINLNWENIISGVLSSGWVEKMHTQVPGPDGAFGFGGACFPKDTKALSYIFKQNNIEDLVLSSVIEQNKKIRCKNDRSS